MENMITRKEFLKKLGLIGVAAFGGSTLLTACSKGGEQSGGGAAADPCADISGLSDADKQTRTQFQYATTSADPNKTCDKCALWQGVTGSGPCGACQVVKGPIAVLGTCTAFAAKPA